LQPPWQSEKLHLSQAPSRPRRPPTVALVMLAGGRGRRDGVQTGLQQEAGHDHAAALKNKRAQLVAALTARPRPPPTCMRYACGGKQGDR
jgi:hypothetical protein